jgi:hypothetical protein
MSEKKIIYINFNELTAKSKKFEFEFTDFIIDFLKELGVNVKIVAFYNYNFLSKDDVLSVIYIDDSDKKVIEIAERFYKLMTDDHYIEGDDEGEYPPEIYDNSAIKDILEEYGNYLHKIIIIEKEYKGKLFIFI